MATTSREHTPRLTTSDQRLDFVLQTLRAKDSNSLFNWLTNPVVALNHADGQKYVDEDQVQRERQSRTEVIARLPPVTFAEALRMLDPYVVSKNVDALADIAVSPSMAQLTPLGSAVNVYGTRIIYARLLHTLLYIWDLRTEALGASGNLLLNDFIVLLRAAGAASDMVRAKLIWKKMVPHGYTMMRHSQLYGEFLRARFLTERLYTQHDPVRMRVQAVNMHRQKKILHNSRLYHLERMRIRAERGVLHRFGQNINMPDRSEHLTRVLRSRKTLTKVYTKACISGQGHDERVQAAGIIALGRNSSLFMLQDLLLKRYGVKTRRIKGTRGHTVVGSRELPSESPLYPSATLLDAVVQTYCCNNMVPLALQTVTHFSQEYNIKIPDRTWYDLLNWAYALSSPRIDREFEIAGYPQRTTSRGMVKAIWGVMTSEPYNVKPGFEQYSIVIKSMLNNDSSILPALQLMRELKPHYQALLTKQVEAMQVVAETRQLRHRDRGAANYRLQRIIAEKWRVWFYFHSWCLRILKKSAHAEPGGELIARLIPKVIDEFRPFVHRYTWYATPTGMVTLREPHNHSKLVSEKIAFKMPTTRPSARFRNKDPAVLDEADPNGEPNPVDHFDPTFFSGSSVTNHGAIDKSDMQVAKAGPTTGQDEMEEYKVKIKVDIDNYAHDTVVDKAGNVLTPEQLRWYDRRFLPGTDLRRIVTRQRAKPNVLINSRGLPGRDRESLIREFA
ncbi:hypothetical protein Sste5346_007297 [Sporothrix stenoceras]|uniref:Uncharacterized protein n=1 Tax=Sporothrix stenoceras TaxID=5173 RepID=A0ABR3YU86_9PEZI